MISGDTRTASITPLRAISIAAASATSTRSPCANIWRCRAGAGSRYRLYRHPLVMFGVGPIYLFILRHRLPFGLMREGWAPWVSTMATNGAIALVVAGMMWWIGVWPFLLVHLPITADRRSDRSVAVLRPASIRAHRLVRRTGIGASRRRRSTAVRITICRPCCAGSPPISACITSTICAAEFRFTGCRLRFASTPIWRMSAGSLWVRVLPACASCCGTKRRTGLFRFANCELGLAPRAGLRSASALT